MKKASGPLRNEYRFFLIFETVPVFRKMVTELQKEKVPEVIN